MPAFLTFAISLLHLAVYTEALVIVVLMFLVLRLCIGVDWLANQRDRARGERDEARETLAVIRRMSEIRVETVTRLRGFAG
ncbi:MAG TPA: hypothetical protein VNY27_07050 [Solirubrobacteraceae bacterium]|jgi:hypothetical protein|nr:hypothetical protein [Solirubrobacteraceae bacterium]